MEYKNIVFFVDKWHIKERRIRTLCAEGRLYGAKKSERLGLFQLIQKNR